jgi:hypothetical protein
MIYGIWMQCYLFMNRGGRKIYILILLLKQVKHLYTLRKNYLKVKLLGKRLQKFESL